jgi:hypothetical protein
MGKERYKDVRLPASRYRAPTVRVHQSAHGLELRRLRCAGAKAAERREKRKPMWLEQTITDSTIDRGEGTSRTLRRYCVRTEQGARSRATTNSAIEWSEGAYGFVSDYAQQGGAGYIPERPRTL